MNTSGKAHIQYTYKGHRYDVEFEVIDQDVPNILGLYTCIDMNLVQCIKTVADDTNDVFEKYDEVFNGLGCFINIQYHINVNQRHKPVVYPHNVFQSSCDLKCKKNSNVWNTSM